MQMKPDVAFPFGDTADSWQDELLQLKAKLDAAEKLRLSGQRGFTLEESRKRLEAIWHDGET